MDQGDSTHDKHEESRMCFARMPADSGSLFAAAESRQLSRILASLAALAKLGGALRRRAPYGAGRASRGGARFARPGLGLAGCLALRMFRRS